MQRNWSSTTSPSNFLASILWFGLMHRTKLWFVSSSSCVSCASESAKFAATYRAARRPCPPFDAATADELRLDEDDAATSAVSSSSTSAKSAAMKGLSEVETRTQISSGSRSRFFSTKPVTV